VWHLPEFMVPSWAGSSGGSGILDIRQIGKFVIFAMAVAIVITWVFDNTKGSLLMATLMHASIDTFSVPLGCSLPLQTYSTAFCSALGC
jgi:uncharacterized protein